jgi:dihydroorotase
VRLAIRNARLVTPEGVAEGGVLVEDGVIRAVGRMDAADAIDARGRHLAPGIVDLGVFAVDRAACRAGGIVRVAPMPNQSPVLDEPGAVQRLSLIGKPDLWIHPIAAATRGLGGQELAEMAICRAAGARAVGTGRRWIADAGVMARVLGYARDLDLAVIAQDGGLAANAVATAGETATRLGLPAAPALAEALAVARDLMLAEETGARLHIRQVTTAAALDLIRAAKRRGVPVTCGVTPAHLLLSDIAVSDFRTFAHLSPPLRSEADRQATRAAIADGTTCCAPATTRTGRRRSACPSPMPRRARPARRRCYRWR